MECLKVLHLFVFLPYVEPIAGNSLQTGNCDFNADTCGYQLVKDFKFYPWTRHTGDIKNINPSLFMPNRPLSDRTNKSGYYLTTDSRQLFLLKNITFRVISQPLFSKDSFCIKFWYFYPNNDNLFSVKLLKNNTVIADLWIAKQSISKAWMEVNISLPGYDFPFQISFDVVKPWYPSVSAAIDDITFLSHCEESASPQPSTVSATAASTVSSTTASTSVSTTAASTTVSTTTASTSVSSTAASTSVSSTAASTSVSSTAASTSVSSTKASTSATKRYSTPMAGYPTSELLLTQTITREHLTSSQIQSTWKPATRSTYYFPISDITRVQSLATDMKPDPYLKRRLDVKATYSIKCSSLDDFTRYQILHQVATIRYRHIEDICGGLCQRSSDGIIIACGNDQVTIMWPTTILYEGGIQSIPNNDFIAITDRLRVRREYLDLFLPSHIPPVIFPNTNSDGLIASLELTPVCENGYMYDKHAEACRNL